MTSELSITVPAQAATPGPLTRWPGVLLTIAGAAGALLAHALVPAVGVLTWAVLLGALAANLGRLPVGVRPGLTFATRKLLRVGVALLGLSLPLAAIAGLGLPVIGMIVLTLATTLVATTWLGMRMGVGRSRSLLIGTGFAICGASAIAAMEENAEADEDDVAVAIGMVTLFGSVLMIALPLLQGPLGLTDTQLGVWAGAGVQEVGQVVAAASPAGAAAVSVAVVVKLTRVLLLAPVVAGVSLQRRRRLDADDLAATSTPPIVPLFVAAFLALVAVRSLGLLPPALLDLATVAQTAALAAALFGMGTAVDVRSLGRGSGPVLALATVATMMVAAISLCGAFLLA